MGWRVSSSMRTDFVLDALKQVPWARQTERAGTFVCHPDRRSKCARIRCIEWLTKVDIEPSSGSKGDSYDNALAATGSGLYEAEPIHRPASWKTEQSGELETLERRPCSTITG